MHFSLIKVSLKKVAVLIVALIVIVVAAVFTTRMTAPNLDFRWENIDIEEERVFVTRFTSDPYVYIPSRIMGSSHSVDGQIYLYAGSGKLTFNGKKEKYFFLYITALISDFKVGPKKSGWSNHILAFMSNSSLLDIVSKAYGFPHLHVNIYARQTKNAPIDKAYLRFENIKGETLAELSIMVRLSGSLNASPSEECLRRLEDQGLIALYLVGNSTAAVFQQHTRDEAHVNATFTENSEMLKYLGWNSHLIRNQVQYFYLTRKFNGKFRWAEWS